MVKVSYIHEWYDCNPNGKIILRVKCFGTRILGQFFKTGITKKFGKTKNKKQKKQKFIPEKNQINQNYQNP
jgi:hypothetical protein